MTEHGALPVESNTPQPQTFSDDITMAKAFDEHDIYIKKGCKLCNSDHRFQAETLWETTRFNVANVKKFLDGKGESIDSKSIGNHMTKHFGDQQRKILRKAYAENLSEYMAVRNDAQKDIDLCRAALKKELFDAGVRGNDMPASEQNRNVELMIKIISQILACADAERKHNGDLHMAEVIIAKLTQIFDIETLNAPKDYQVQMGKVMNTFLNELESSNIVKIK